ncbi:PQQ-binding-like beta-propeller repeat protein [Verrucomicrobiota bacterium]
MKARRLIGRVVAACFGGALVILAGQAAAAEDWPTYGHDNQRSSVSADSLSVPLSESWTFVARVPPAHAWGDPQPKPVEGLLELPRLRFDDAFHVAAVGELVYFGSSSEHMVYALDAATGEVEWEFYTDAPVRIAPSVWQGRLYAGCDDGVVYCLEAETGKPCWTFRAAPRPDKILGNGKMISVWPVRTGVLVEDGVAYFGAGVFPAEELYLYAVDAESGDLLWRNNTYGRSGNANISPQGYMLATEDRLVVPSGRTTPAVFDRETGRFLFTAPVMERLSGGSYCALVDDLLVNGTEQLTVSRVSDGEPRFVEGARRVVADGDALYFLTGSAIAAMSRSAWQDLSEDKTRLGALNALRLAITSSESTLDRYSSYVREFEERISQSGEDVDDETRVNLDRLIAGRLSREQALAKLKEEETELAGELRREARWWSECGFTDAALLSRNLLVVGGPGQVKALDRLTGEEVWSASVDGVARGLALARGRLLVSTDRGRIHCFVPGRAAGGGISSPETTGDVAPDDRLTVDYAHMADFIAADSGIQRGYGLIVGGNGRLAGQLAKRTDLSIYVVDGDAQRVAATRRALSGAGLHGARVNVIHGELGDLSLPDYFANLVVCLLGEASGGSLPAPSELLRLLKPCGGAAYLGHTLSGKPSRSARRAAKKWTRGFGRLLKERGDEDTVVETGGGGVRVYRGPLPGAGRWTHQYAEPGNTGCGNDALIRGPLGLLWFGEPGPARMPSRHDSAASPLALGGRVFIQGENVIMAHDAYNGLKLWEREIPGAMRLGTSAGPSNLAADERSLFVVANGRCLRLDAETGATIHEYTATPDDEEDSADWGLYIARVGGLLYGSSSREGRAGSMARRFGGADRVFALDVKTGELRWEHTGEEMMLNTIAVGGGRLYFVQRAVTDEQRDQALEGIEPATRLDRRGQPIEPDVRLVAALDAKTGEPLWEHPEYVSDCVDIGKGGGDLTLMYAKDVVVLAAQPWNGHFWGEFLAGEFSRRSLIALSADDGRPLWSGRKGYRSRPIIVGDRIVAEPWAYDLKTGADRTTVHPFTGKKTKWQMSRPGHHCGNIVAAPNMLFFRSGMAAYYDLEKDYGTVHLGGQRPGCWINIIPANGVVVMPEASSGCVCQYPLHCTTAFMPGSRRSLPWGVSSAGGPAEPVSRIRVNFGAPGDRRASDGALWTSYPRPYDFRLALDFGLSVQSRTTQAFETRSQYDTWSIDGPDPWIYNSAALDPHRITLFLVSRDEGPVSLRAAAPPAVDAHLSDECWDGLEIVPLAGGTGAVMFRHDDENLYVAYEQFPREVGDEDEPLWDTPVQGEDAAVWEGDSFEVFFSDAGSISCLHLAVAPSGACYDGLWQYTEYDFPTFDIPKLDAIAVDGRTNDWDGGAFTISSLPDQDRRMRTKEDLDASVCAAWSEEGLLLLVRVADQEIAEGPDGSLWNGDCVEIWMTPHIGSPESYQAIVGTGADPLHATTRVKIEDRRNSLTNTPLSIKAEGGKTEDGYAVEILLPWANLDIEPGTGTVAQVQVIVNDPHEGTEWFDALFHPSGRSHRNTTAYHHLRLATNASPAVKFIRTEVPDEDGLFTASPPYPYPMELSLLGAREEDGERDTAWTSAARVSDLPGEEGVFFAEFALPWSSLADAGIDVDKLTVELTNRGPLSVLPGGERTQFQNLAVVSDGSVKPLRYTVRMHFAELDDVGVGERVFDVRLQGRKVLEAFDIVKAAGGRGRPVVKEFRGIPASGALALEFLPTANGIPRGPLINGLEVIR